MGYAVLHLEKAKGADTGMSAHIERTIHPKNADESRTHLNKELIEFPDGIHSRSEAISYRINTAGITRKIGKNQVRAIRVLLTGTYEDMKRIEDNLIVGVKIICNGCKKHTAKKMWCRQFFTWTNTHHISMLRLCLLLPVSEEKPKKRKKMVNVNTERRKLVHPDYVQMM